MTREQEIAWAAGLFEGEGSFVARKKQSTQKQYFSAVLETSDQDVLLRFLEVVGVGKVSGPYTGQKRVKPTWRWAAYGLEGKQAAEIFRPFLGLRRTARLDELLSLTV